MLKFNIEKIEIEGIIIIKPLIFEDDRGFFMETYNKRDFFEIGIKMDFIQDNHSKSDKGVLRGLHFQKKHEQDKLVRVIKGSVLDIAVDIRKDSITYGKYSKIMLSAENKKIHYIPKGFAHGFLSLENNTELLYKCSDYYYPEYDTGIRWNDTNLNIDWELEKYKINFSDLKISEKDKNLPFFI